MNGPSPLVSIITPYFNAAHFLAEAVESVLVQTYANWELLLIDDGSTDDSPEIALDYAKKYAKRIFYLRHDDENNHGLPATRNLGLCHCRGEFVALLDSDDYWFPRKIEQQIALLQRQPEAGMVFGRSEYWYDWENSGDSGRNTMPELAPGNRLYQPPELLKMCHPLGKYGAPCPSDLMIRSSAINDVGGFEERFNDHYMAFEDIAFMTKVFLRYPVYVSDKCWDRYRRHSESLWSKAQASGDEAKGRANYFSWLNEYLVKNGVTDAELWRLYRKNTWEYRNAKIFATIQTMRRMARPFKRYLLDHLPTNKT